MEFLNKMDWGLVWEITKDIIIPHSGTLLLNSTLFLIIGFFLSIGYIILLSKKRILKRKPKYYNWAVKLYIPILLGTFLYIFGQIGFLRGVYNILITEKDAIVTSMYTNTLHLGFKSEESKDVFIKGLQEYAKDTRDKSDFLALYLKITSLNYNTNISVLDDSKNKMVSYLIEVYGDEIYKMATYEMLNLAGTKAHANVDELLPYDEFSMAMDFLLDVGYKDIELAIKDKLMIWFVSLLDSQYHSMIKSLLILLVIMMSIPALEFLIYMKWIEPKLITNEYTV